MCWCAEASDCALRYNRQTWRAHGLSMLAIFQLFSGLQPPRLHALCLFFQRNIQPVFDERDAALAQHVLKLRR